MSAVVSLDRVIHEAARLVIVATLAVVDEADFVYLQRHTHLTAGNIASHTERLKEAGYLEVDKGQGGPRRRTIYRLTESGRSTFEAYRHSLAALLGFRP